MAEWLTDGQSGFNWIAKSRQHWNMTFLSEPDPLNSGAYLEPDFLRFVADVDAATGSMRGSGGGSGFSFEVSCGILEDSGKIACWGSPSNNVMNVPTGTNFGFGQIAIGNLSGSTTSFNPAWAALDNSGCIHTWGNNGAPPSNGFDANKPTSCGWDTVGVGTGVFGCVADSAGAGVTCWKPNTYGSFEVADGAPTTGSFKNIAISKKIAVGVKTDGSVVLWGDSIDSPNLISAWNAAGVTKAVQEARVYGDTGQPNVVLYHDDHTITLVKDPDTTSNLNVVVTAPCLGAASSPGGTCPSSSAHVWTSAIKFRSSPEINRNNTHRICGVVESDPDNQYNPGAVICWGGTYSAATFAPRVIDDSCPQPAWWLPAE